MTEVMAKEVMAAAIMAAAIMATAIMAAETMAAEMMTRVTRVMEEVGDQLGTHLVNAAEARAQVMMAETHNRHSVGEEDWPCQ